MAFVIPQEETHSKLPHFNKHIFDSNSHAHQLHQAALHMLDSHTHSHAHHLDHPNLQVLVDLAKRARSFHPLPEHILDGTAHNHTIPTPIVFAAEPLTPQDPWLLIHPADINLFQVYEDRRLRASQSTKHAEVYHMNAYTIISSIPRILLPVNMIALDNLRGTIVSLDRFYNVEAKNGPPHLHHIVTDRVGRTHDLCSARYVERGAYRVNSYDSHQESRGKIVATEGVVPFPEEVEFYSFYFRKDGTRPIYSNAPEIRICSVPRTQKSLKGKNAEIGTQRYEDLSSQDPDPSQFLLRRKPSVLAKIGGTIKSKVRSMTAPVPIRSSKKNPESPEGPLNLTHSPQAMSMTNSITPLPQFTPTQSRRATATRLDSSPFRRDLDIDAPAPLQRDGHLAVQEFDISAIRATARSPPPPSQPTPPLQHHEKNSPPPTAEVEGADGDTYLTPVTTKEDFPPLPSPACASTPISKKPETKAGESFSSCVSTPRSVKEFKAGKSFPPLPSPASGLEPMDFSEFKIGEGNLPLELDGELGDSKQ